MRTYQIFQISRILWRDQSGNFWKDKRVRDRDLSIIKIGMRPRQDWESRYFSLETEMRPRVLFFTGTMRTLRALRTLGIKLEQSRWMILQKEQIFLWTSLTPEENCKFMHYVNSYNSSMQRRRVPRKIKEYGKTKISESTSNTASRSRPIPKENPNRLWKRTNHNIFYLSEFQKWQRNENQSNLTLADWIIFFTIFIKELWRPKLNLSCLNLMALFVRIESQ